ncbi:MAG TPA: hypothetical protein VN706_10420 [Gemmatimonadaceae bacterium]|nr:hypothetical protein [Gemmatimonadaceae bacterium]
MRLRPFLCLPCLAAVACASGNSPGAAVPAGAPDPMRIGNVGIATDQRLQITTTNGENMVALQHPVADVWRVLRSAYDSLGITVGSVDPTMHVIGTNGFLRVRRHLGNSDVPLSKYIDCGSTQGPPSADTYELEMQVRTEVRPVTGDASRSNLVTLVQAQGRPIGMSADYAVCPSKGVIEQRLAEIVDKQLR